MAGICAMFEALCTSRLVLLEWLEICVKEDSGGWQEKEP